MLSRKAQQSESESTSLTFAKSSAAEMYRTDRHDPPIVIRVRLATEQAIAPTRISPQCYCGDRYCAPVDAMNKIAQILVEPAILKTLEGSRALKKLFDDLDNLLLPPVEERGQLEWLPSLLLLHLKPNSEIKPLRQHSQALPYICRSNAPQSVIGRHFGRMIDIDLYSLFTEQS